MKITYAGKQAWRVAYVLSGNIPVAATTDGRNIGMSVTRVGYKTPFADSLEEARDTVTRELYKTFRGVAKYIRFLNTEPWHGEPLDEDALFKRVIRERNLEAVPA